MDVVRHLRDYCDLKRDVERAMEWLDDDEQMIIEMLYIVPKTGNVERICQELGIEKATVYRRRDKALRKLGLIMEISKMRQCARRGNGRTVVK